VSLLTDLLKKDVAYILVRGNSTPISGPPIMKALFSCYYSGTNDAVMRRHMPPPLQPDPKNFPNHRVVIILSQVKS